jgi:butyryl-CoA dehydrogenase
LGRKVSGGGGQALFSLRDEILASCARADDAGVDRARTQSVREALECVAALTTSLLGRGAQNDLEGMLGHATDYLELLSILVVGWMWTEMAARAPKDDFGRGIDHAARYWMATEIPRIGPLSTLCETAERSYLDLSPDWL